jgi:hypothetical protein
MKIDQNEAKVQSRTLHETPAGPPSIAVGEARTPAEATRSEPHSV